FSPDAEAPCRLEFFGDEIDSIRQFSPETQRSLGDVPELEMTAASPKTGPTPAAGYQPPADTGHHCEHLPADAWTALVEPDDLQVQGKHYLERIAQPVGVFMVNVGFQPLRCFASMRIP